MIDRERLSYVADLPLELEVAIRSEPMLASRLLAMRVGDVIVTPVPAGTTLTLCVGKAQIGAAELLHKRGRPSIRMVQVGGRT